MRKWRRKWRQKGAKAEWLQGGWFDFYSFFSFHVSFFASETCGEDGFVVLVGQKDSLEIGGKRGVRQRNKGAKKKG